MGTVIARSAAAGLLLILPISLCAEDRRTDTSRLSVMTINTLFMWDGIAPEEGSSSIQFPWKGDPDAARDHMEELAQLIKASNPDIINLVEVENLDAVNLLNDTFLTGYGYKASLVEGTDTFTGQDVCILSRIDPEEFARLLPLARRVPSFYPQRTHDERNRMR